MVHLGMKRIKFVPIAVLLATESLNVQKAPTSHPVWFVVFAVELVILQEVNALLILRLSAKE